MTPTQIAAGSILLSDTTTKSAESHPNLEASADVNLGGSGLGMLLPYLLAAGLGSGVGYAVESKGDQIKKRTGGMRALRGALMGTGTLAGGHIGGTLGGGLGFAAGFPLMGVGAIPGMAVGGALGAGAGGYGGYKLMRKVLGE